MVKKDKGVVAVGMSGGVDSTMAAHFLQKEGFEVIGLTMAIWDDSLSVKSTRSGCYGPHEREDIESAQRVAQKLQITHRVIDLHQDYQEVVIKNFREEYLAGRTPIPCVRCNAMIKFGVLWEKAFAAGIFFDFFATGHYARIEYDSLNGRFSLKRGIDETKDQSYFLYRLRQDQLARTIFPLGHYRKHNIWTLAKEEGFDEFLKEPESQDFFEANDYGLLLQAPEKPGKILDANGRIIGQHRGIAYYTVGQRKGLNLPGLKEPYYVLKMDADRNEIMAGPRRDLLQHQLIAEDLHWIVPLHSIPNRILQAQVRYRSRPVDCLIYPEDEQQVRVKFIGSRETVAPGQSIVFFDEDTVLGGGIIQKQTDSIS